jgi:flagellar motor switch protein FliG
VGQEDMNERASKAAIILLALGGSLGSRLIKEFEPGEIRKFANSAASLNEIDPTFLGNLVDEFSLEMSKPALLRGGDQQTRNFLAEAMPADQVNKILGAEDVPFAPVWQSFAAGSENSLVPYLLDEHPQTITFFLTKLDIDLSA